MIWKEMLDSCVQPQGMWPRDEYGTMRPCFRGVPNLISADLERQLTNGGAQKTGIVSAFYIAPTVADGTAFLVVDVLQQPGEYITFHHVCITAPNVSHLCCTCRPYYVRGA